MDQVLPVYDQDEDIQFTSGNKRRRDSNGGYIRKRAKRAEEDA